jgi:hypothetical protein
MIATLERPILCDSMRTMSRLSTLGELNVEPPLGDGVSIADNPVNLDSFCGVGCVWGCKTMTQLLGINPWWFKNGHLIGRGTVGAALGSQVAGLSLQMQDLLVQ